VTAVLALAGAAAARAVLDPAEAGAAAVGLGAAWAVQAGAYWTLAGRLASGRRALGVWIGGVAARIAGLAVLVVAAGPAGWPMVTVVVAYGVGVVAGLMLEVLWLWKAPGRAPARTTDRRRE
jgi:hypothetical protein